jgi:hypothetical protein
MDDTLAGWYTGGEKQVYLLVKCLSDICTADDLSFQTDARMQYGADFSSRVHALHRPPGFAKPLAHGQLRRLVPLPLVLPSIRDHFHAALPRSFDYQ